MVVYKFWTGTVVFQNGGIVLVARPGRCKHRNTGASTGIDRNTGESRRNAPEYTVCVNVYDVCACSVWLYFVFNVSRTN